MSVTGTPQLDAMQMEMIGQIVQKELAYKAKLMPTVTDVSSFAIEGADSISFPKTGSFTATNRAKSGTVGTQALTFDKDTLLLDQSPTVKYIVDSYANLQSRVNAEIESAKRAASAQARFVDFAIANEIMGVAGHVINGIPADVTSSNMLELQEFILQNNGELEDMVYVASIDQRTKLLELPQFTEAQVYGGQPTAIQTGVIGMIYGVPVIITNGIGAQNVLCYSKEALALGFQKGFTRDEEKAIDYGTGATKVVYDAVFGVKGCQLGQGTEIDGSTALAANVSALVAKLN